MKPGETPSASGTAAKDAVLLIDDERPLLDVFSAALSPYFEVTLAGSAREAEFILHKKAFKVAVADTTGCGDTFHGAYALALSEGRPPLAAARFASAAAAVKAQRGRGWDGMGDRAAIETMLATGAVHPH